MGTNPTLGQPKLPRVSRHLVLAILAVLACLPLGIVAALLSSQVKQRLAAGDVAGARSASKQVLIWSLLGILIGSIVFAVQILK